MKKPLTDMDYVVIYADKLKQDNSLFAQQKILIESQLKASASLFENMFRGKDFKKSAREYLKERGIMLRESKSAQEGEFVNLIQLEIKTDKESKNVCGTLSSNLQPRIVKIDDYYLELYPIGEMVFIRNWDKPGLIGSLGSLMGNNGINIAAMTFGRDKPGGQAISILNVDSQVGVEIQEEIKKLENILTVKVIRT